MATTDDALRCCACGYSLKGVGTAAACPECAEPTERSWLWAERAAGVMPSPVATRRWLAVQATMEAALVLAVVATPAVINATEPDSPRSLRAEDTMAYLCLGLWSAAMLAASSAAVTLARGSIPVRAWATALAGVAGAAALAGGLLARAVLMAGWTSTGGELSRQLMMIAMPIASVGAILMHATLSRVIDAVPDAAHRPLRWLSFLAGVGQSAWLAAVVLYLVRAPGIPVFVACVVIWALGTALSSARGWLLFAAIRRWTVRASRPPSVASPSPG